MLSAVFSGTDFYGTEGSDKRRMFTGYVWGHEKKGVVKDDFYETVMERERKTTTTIGNGISLPHGSPTAVIESKVAVAFLEEPVIWDDEQIQIVFLLGFKMNTRDEIHRIQLFYKEYVSLIDTEEKIKMLRNMKSSIEVYKYLIQ